MSIKRQLPDQQVNKEPGPAAKAGPDDHYLPPRQSVHPTEKDKWVFIFYRTLLWIFVLLVVGLLIWGWWTLFNS
ncbi:MULTISPECIES: hypothetical protein [unclassified Paenibacillus]|uniref:hypothetical protein n=1 Tax=unclassified Paenibacillus TaxID=185978 RepID=UPI001AE3CCC4|nr:MULTISPECIES: hypothetical protein [unclassified Paenibacillus]MBP1155227.1 hypothetical protein [Paenibacillus sp. PvP091]MBP1169389.1 hypothetical protein [Paenibacillus sp. PvR098]MBP2440417.1 hypothetical protein [Paenibacillus sp. PvP052]